MRECVTWGKSNRDREWNTEAVIQASEEKEAVQQGVTGGRKRNTEAAIQESEEEGAAQEGSRCEKDAGNTHRLMSCGKKAQRDNVSEGWD